VVVVITGGDPTACAIQDAQTIAALAKSAKNHDGVRTYGIAVKGATVPDVEAIATAGGGVAHDATADTGAAAAALQSILSQAGACAFAIPPSPGGQPFPEALIDVLYTPGGSTTPTTWPNVASASACAGAGAEGWYFDDNATPLKILLCPEACEKLIAAPAAKVSMRIGCPLTGP
jgi:hypothetical protein